MPVRGQVVCESGVLFAGRRECGPEHPVSQHELPEPDRVHLFVNAAQHGLGSRARGFDVLPHHANKPAARTIELHIDVNRA